MLWFCYLGLCVCVVTIEKYSNKLLWYSTYTTTSFYE